MLPVDETIRRRWTGDGFVVVPRLLDDERVRELRRVCDRVFEQWVRESRDPEMARNTTNMAYLTELRFFEDHPEQLELLLNTIADERILHILSQLSDRELIFHNTQYFFDPAARSRHGDWHRDQQFQAPDEEAEKRRMRNTVGVHVHIAFVPDDNLEYVPGSHARWDTPEELEIRKGLNGKKPNSTMPFSERIRLEAGDAVFFDAWGIHRGNYIAGTPRRTFDALYGTRPDWFNTPPTCFLKPGLLDPLQPQARAFFTRYIETYRDDWSKGDYEM